MFNMILDITCYINSTPISLNNFLKFTYNAKKKKHAKEALVQAKEDLLHGLHIPFISPHKTKKKEQQK